MTEVAIVLMPPHTGDSDAWGWERGQGLSIQEAPSTTLIPTGTISRAPREQPDPTKHLLNNSISTSLRRSLTGLGWESTPSQKGQET